MTEAQFCTERLQEAEGALGQLKRSVKRGMRAFRGTPSTGIVDVTEKHVARLQKDADYWAKRLKVLAKHGG
jgi:hypothetical protein